MSSTQTAEASSNGRDTRGRFTAGNPGGPGNPFARASAQLRKAFVAETSEEDLRKVARAMVEQAQQGDVAAARLVLAYTLGKPMEAVDPDRVHELEWLHFKAEAIAAGEASAVINGIGAEWLCRVLRIVLPLFAQINQEKLLEALAAPAAADLEEEEQQEQAKQEQEEPQPAPREKPRTQEEVLAALQQAHREALEQVRSTVSGESLPREDAADDKRPASVRCVANDGRITGDTPTG